MAVSTTLMKMAESVPVNTATTLISLGLNSIRVTPLEGTTLGAEIAPRLITEARELSDKLENNRY
jgi:hypothetical protein